MTGIIIICLTSSLCCLLNYLTCFYFVSAMLRYCEWRWEMHFTANTKYDIWQKKSILHCTGATSRQISVCRQSNWNCPWWRHKKETFSACGIFTGHQWIPGTKASDAELWCFLRCASEINGWVNNGEAGDLRRHVAHYDVTDVTGICCLCNRERLPTEIFLLWMWSIMSVDCNESDTALVYPHNKRVV